MRSTIARILMIAAAGAALAGCTRGTDDLHQWVAQQKARKGEPLPPLPVVKTFESFTYNDQGKRDPFAVSPESVRNNAQSGPRPDQNRPKEPLESFSLDSLKMVGTIGTGKNTIALISDPTGVIHQVRVNEYMGQNYGHVTDIKQDHLDLVELVPNGNGGWMERDASISLGEQ